MTDMDIEKKIFSKPETVENYTFKTENDEVSLSELFGDQTELILIHNMGKSCPYCTLWADGFNGIVQHLENRAAFVLVSPDDPQTQKEFARSRNWVFKMFSTQGSAFSKDMGFESDNGSPEPGVSVFVKDGDSITRVSKASFGPGDDFCVAWHLFGLLPKGADGWQPKYEY